jgi:hypothetical protein
MNEAAMTRRLTELIEAITSSPFADQISAGSLQGVSPSEAPARKSSPDSCLDHLRLQIKYLLFDLEATRRENRYLRQMLESRHKRDVDDLRGDGSDAL